MTVSEFPKQGKHRAESVVPSIRRAEQKRRKRMKDIKKLHLQISRQIGALERAVLSFQAGAVSAGGTPAAIDSNIAIILSSRLSNVWKRLGSSIYRNS